MEITVRIAGEAGQGIQSIGRIICRAIKRHGWNLFADQDYMSRIRGGNNSFRIRISDTPCLAPREKTDILIALNRESVAIHEGTVRKKGLIVADEATDDVTATTLRYFNVPIGALAKASGGKSLYENSVVCGVITGLLHLDPDAVVNVLKDMFGKKGEETGDKNITAFREGNRYTRDNYFSDAFHLGRRQYGDGIVINGNEAVALGAVHAGCKFYSAYPMSPSTGIMASIARFAKRFGIVVEQAEDEIAAINMVIGASYAGVRAMTGTSGGGFALMGEGVSLAAMTETPLVVVDVQRPAPATGFPTRTEQADLDLLIHAGHGEFARVIYAPGTAEEAFSLTVKAFDIAEKYQIPVFIMSDQHLADSYRNVTLPDVGALSRQRHVIPTNGQSVHPYKRYALTGSGISPRAVPSWIDDVIYADSDEHTEEGHITEDARIRTLMVQKRFTMRMNLLSKEMTPPSASSLSRTEIVLVGFGSTCGVMQEACGSVSGMNVGYIHLPQVWPFPAEEVRTLLEDAPEAKIVSFENNAAGQLARLLRRETGIACCDSILKYDGRPFTVDEVVATVKERYSSL
ncbi:MAG: 2-oxoacid:acceptor oxidoreductase subunit alpha [Chitinispirillaceae bacterium]|nr:2-oxoacid:acceptor oxidoreductase subunit alpha [Chitinispirillaceae bacterium]